MKALTLVLVVLSAPVLAAPQDSRLDKMGREVTERAAKDMKSKDAEKRLSAVKSLSSWEDRSGHDPPHPGSFGDADEARARGVRPLPRDVRQGGGAGAPGADESARRSAAVGRDPGRRGSRAGAQGDGKGARTGPDARPRGRRRHRAFPRRPQPGQADPRGAPRRSHPRLRRGAVPGPRLFRLQGPGREPEQHRDRRDRAAAAGQGDPRSFAAEGPHHRDPRLPRAERHSAQGPLPLPAASRRLGPSPRGSTRRPAIPTCSRRSSP